MCLTQKQRLCNMVIFPKKKKKKNPIKELLTLQPAESIRLEIVSSYKLGIAK